VTRTSPALTSTGAGDLAQADLPAQTGDHERPALNRTRILEAALDLVDHEGLEALSMRRLGAVLGVEAMSLYHHIPSKAELLDGLVALLLRQVPLPEVAAVSWDDALVTGFVDFRRVMLAHPAAFALVCSRPAAEPQALAVIARAFAVLSAAGFTPSDARAAWNTLLCYALGYIECEVTGVGKDVRSGAMREAIRAQVGPEFAALRAAWADWSPEAWSDDVEYRRGLEAILAGLDHRRVRGPLPASA
jgi:AcrR family transcriptional regulator